MREDPQLLGDIRLQLQHNNLRPVYTTASDRRRITQVAQPVTDFGQVRGRDNLAQAVFLRLLTPRGELAALGHPEYGSRLHELIGRQNTETTRSLLRLFILEALQQEPRIEAVTQLTVTPHSELRDTVIVQLDVQPVPAPERPASASDQPTTLTLGPFTLEIGS